MITNGHRRRLNQAMHELRRPLQALTLLDHDGAAAIAEESRTGLLELARCALGDLDRAVNGGPPAESVRRVSCHQLVLGCLERWRPAAAGMGDFRVYWDAGPGLVEGDPTRIAQALDNLIANALEHGGPPLIVTGAEVAGRLRITVANGRAAMSDDSGATTFRPNGDLPDEDPRRGHGTAVVSKVASAHHGRFALCRTGDGCVAALELPLADPRYAQAA